MKLRNNLELQYQDAASTLFTRVDQKTSCSKKYWGSLNQSWINYIISVQLQLCLQIGQLHYNYSVIKNQITITTTFTLVIDYKLKLQILFRKLDQ